MKSKTASHALTRRPSRTMLERIDAELLAADTHPDAKEYLERRLILYVKGFEELLDRAIERDDIDLAHRILTSLTRMTSAHKLKIEVGIVPPGLRKAPSLKDLSAEELRQMKEADDATVVAVAEKLPAAKEP